MRMKPAPSNSDPSVLRDGFIGGGFILRAFMSRRSAGEFGRHAAACRQEGVTGEQRRWQVGRDRDAESRETGRHLQPHGSHPCRRANRRKGQETGVQDPLLSGSFWSEAEGLHPSQST